MMTMGGHGTHVSGGIIAALNNDIGGVVGVAPKAQIYSVKAFDNRGGARSCINVVEALQWCIEQKKSTW